MKVNILGTIEEPLTEEPPGEKMKSLYFGIFTASDENINNGVDT